MVTMTDYVPILVSGKQVMVEQEYALDQGRIWVGSTYADIQ